MIFILANSLISLDLSEIMHESTKENKFNSEYMHLLLLDFKFLFSHLEKIKLKCEVSDSNLINILKILNNANFYPKLRNLEL